MFRRRWNALPADPIFGDTLEQLGYFVNEDDEIRSIKDPLSYFKFFLNKNGRWNDRQRFHMNSAVEEIVHERLEKLDLKKVNLPLDTRSDQPHVPIFISKNLATAKRILVVIQEPYNDLGILAHRIIGGIGGIDQGSMVLPMKYMQEIQPHVGIILANPGQLWWWAEGKKALTAQGQGGVPMKSAVCWGYDNPSILNSPYKIPGNSNEAEHVGTVFNNILGNPHLCDPEAKIDVIGLGTGANTANNFLDTNWDAWRDRVKSFSIVGGTTSKDLIQDERFAQWTRERALGFVLSDEPTGRVISSADGNENTRHYTGFGCPVMSSGESCLIEMMFVRSHKFILDKVKEIAEADAAGGLGYKNPDHGDCDYEDAQLKEQLALDKANDEAWAKADLNNMDWGDNAGPSMADIVGKGPGVVPTSGMGNGEI